jgi:hypothetical protein
MAKDAPDTSSATRLVDFAQDLERLAEALDRKEAEKKKGAP